MNNRYLVFSLSIFVFISGLAYSKGGFDNSTWVYDKVSNTNVFGQHDSNIIAHLDEGYKNVIIITEGGKLKIENDFLEDKSVCSTDYVEVKKTPLSYYLSKNTVGMYKKVYKDSGVLFPDNIYILTSLYPEQECPLPYGEMLKFDDYLTVSEQNYVLFFKREGRDLSKSTEPVKKDDWSIYCHNDKSSHGFDGSSKTLCSFPGMSLNIAYNKFKVIDKSDSALLRPDMPAKNESHEIDVGVVDYKWSGLKMLTVSLVRDNETVSYNFKEGTAGTNLLILTDSQY